MRRRLLNDDWSVRPKVNRFAELSGTPAQEWQPVTLPHDAVVGLTRAAEHGPAGAYFPGGSWEYRRTLAGAAEEGRTVVLEFEGVYRDAAVTVNGQVVARRPYGYSRFLVPVDHLLAPGDNELRVDATAGQDSRWYTGAGLYRDVWLLEGGPVHVAPEGLFVRTPAVDDEVATVLVTTSVVNRTTRTVSPRLRVEVLDADGAVVASAEAPATVLPGATADVERRVLVDRPRLWRLEDPYLHSCRVVLLDGEQVLDDDATSFGIRTLAVDTRRGLRLNGEPVLLRGACVHHDNGPLGAATIARADERRVELLKAAGFNALRSAHNPASRALLDACDRHGMLVMDEAFDTWLEPKSDDDYARRFQQWWRTDLEAMVRGARNHPSVVFYSIGNEIPDGSTQAGLQVGRELAQEVRRLDDSRYVVQAVTGILIGGDELWADFGAHAAKAAEESGVNTVATSMADIMQQVVRSPVVDRRTQEAFAGLDAAGYNYMQSRYELDAAAHPDRPVIGTESHPPAIAEIWEKVLALPSVLGDFTWTGWDYLGEVGIGRAHHSEATEGRGFHGPFPWRTAWCGDLDMTGRRRPQSVYREIVFGLRREPAIAVLHPQHERRPHTNPGPWAWDDVVASWSWPGLEGQAVLVQVYAAAEEVELLLDGRSLGSAPVTSFRAELEVAYSPGVLEAVARTGGEVVGRTQLRSAVPDQVVLRATPDREQVRGDTTDLVFVELALTDGAGVAHATADRTVHVEVDGAAVLQALSSADPTSDEPFTAAECSTFRGYALAVVRPTGAGPITVRVTAEGCPDVELCLQAEEA